MEKDPTEVIRKAVMRMLPRNRLRDVSGTVYLCFCYLGVYINSIVCLVDDVTLS
jgi:hypothetical protein